MTIHELGRDYDKWLDSLTVQPGQQRQIGRYTVRILCVHSQTVDRAQVTAMTPRGSLMILTVLPETSLLVGYAPVTAAEQTSAEHWLHARNEAKSQRDMMDRGW